jgi:hemerythrin-like domain-containing protein
MGPAPEGSTSDHGASGEAMRAVHIIREEHRTSTAVLHGILFLLRHIGYGISEPNFELLGAMIAYMRVFPERHHHPKEDAYLFRLLRKRHSAIAPVLDRLHAEHRANAAKMRAVEDALADFQREGTARLPALYEAVARYAAFHYAHMRTEEDEVLPAALEYLTPADWDEIDAAFSGHTDPLLGAEEGFEYDALFRRIVSMAPAPLGAAPETSREARRGVAAR